MVNASAADVDFSAFVLHHLCLPCAKFH